MPDAPGLMDVIGAAADALDAAFANGHGRTDLGEMAQAAAAESLSAVIGPHLQTLFDTSPEQTRAAFARHTTVKNFGTLARDFFARFTARCLNYFRSRALPRQTGPGQRFRTLEDHAAFTAALDGHQQRHGERHYYRVRSTTPAGAVERAARTIYLNRTCFNGMYRVNLWGVFNVPKGTKATVRLPADNFAAAARLLRRAELLVSDFEPVIDRAAAGDLVFADPPYTVRHNNNGFVKYNDNFRAGQPSAGG